MKTCKEKALEWNVSPRSVNDMCKKGRIQGAIKEKGSWLIPDDSPKPMDGRVSNGKYIKKNKSGMNPKMLQYIMGHSDISVTMNTYTHVKFQDAQEDFQKAINS